jgi:hypothetical protein
MHPSSKLLMLNKRIHVKKLFWTAALRGRTKKCVIGLCRILLINDGFSHTIV